MKKILLIAAVLFSVTAGAQEIVTDGNTGSSIASTSPKYLPFLDQTCNTRVRADFRISKDASLATTDWYYEYEYVIDSSNKVWRQLNSGTFITELHFDDLKVGLFRKVLDSTSLKKVEYQITK